MYTALTFEASFQGQVDAEFEEIKLKTHAVVTVNLVDAALIPAQAGFDMSPVRRERGASVLPQFVADQQFDLFASFAITWMFGRGA